MTPVLVMMLAIDGLLPLHEPPASASVRDTAALTQIAEMPEIEAGSGLTVATALRAQPVDSV